MRLPRTLAERKPRALLGELLIGLVDGVHAFDERLADGERLAVFVLGLDVGEPQGLARLAERVDVHAGRLADVLDGLGGVLIGGGLHGLGWLCR